MMQKFLFAYLGVAAFAAGPAPLKPAIATIDPTGSQIESKSYSSFKLHVFFSDRSGSLYCAGEKFSNKPAVMTCEMTPEGLSVRLKR